MKKIIPSTTEHAEEIANMLSNYFKELNKNFEVALYKTDIDHMRNHVNEKMKEDHENFKYFSLVDDSNNFLGFVNVLKEGNNGEVLVVITKNNSEDDFNYLLEEGIRYLKDNNCENVFFETQNGEELYEKTLEKNGANIYGKKWII